jgi:hypothetical protein
MKTLLLLGLAAFTMSAVAADIYRWVDKDGNIHFSDQPREGAKKVETAPAQTFSPNAPLPTPREAKADTQEAVPDYTVFVIASPTNEEAVRSNPGDVTIRLALSPGLQTGFGHYITLMMDGQTVADKATTTEFTLNNVDRGTHTIQAVIKDHQGRAVRTSDPVTFHLLRAKIGGAP